jgi:hypothetical protein
MLPPLVLVAAAGLAAADEWLRHRLDLPPVPRLARWVAPSLACLLLASLLFLQTLDYLLVPTLQITDKRYDSRDLWGSVQGRHVARVTDEDDTVLAYGHDAGIYYYSGRRCATRYTMVRALAPAYPGFERRRETLLAEVQSNRPRVVLLVDQEPFPELDAWLKANYYLVGTDYHDRRPGEVIMAALMDKARPLAQIDWNWRREQGLRPREDTEAPAVSP